MKSIPMQQFALRCSTRKLSPHIFGPANVRDCTLRPIKLDNRAATIAVRGRAAAVHWGALQTARLFISCLANHDSITFAIQLNSHEAKCCTTCASRCARHSRACCACASSGVSDDGAVQPKFPMQHGAHRSVHLGTRMFATAPELLSMAQHRRCVTLAIDGQVACMRIMHESRCLKHCRFMAENPTTMSACLQPRRSYRS